MPKQYAQGGRVVANAGSGGGHGAVPPPRSFRARVGALRNLPPFLAEIWRTSPWLTLASQP